MTEICKYLKTKGFNNITKKRNELNIIVSNDNLEAILYFYKFKKDIIKITYNKIRGTNKDLVQLNFLSIFFSISKFSLLFLENALYV